MNFSKDLRVSRPQCPPLLEEFHCTVPLVLKVARSVFVQYVKWNIKKLNVLSGIIDFWTSKEIRFNLQHSSRNATSPSHQLDRERRHQILAAKETTTWTSPKENPSENIASSKLQTSLACLFDFYFYIW